MKTCTFIVLSCIMFLGTAFGEQYEFLVNRFCDLRLDTTPGQESIEIKIYPKVVDETKVLFKSKLKKTGSGTYTTDNGISFVLVKLPKEITNDQNRRINSGSWLVTILGEGNEYQKLKNELVPISTFRHDYELSPDSKTEDDMSEMSYLGTKIQKEG